LDSKPKPYQKGVLAMIHWLTFQVKRVGAILQLISQAFYPFPNQMPAAKGGEQPQDGWA
jgi:hypothetical protein